MKKRIITLLLAIVVIATLLTGCGEHTETISSTSIETNTVSGSYSLFRTTEVQEYLNFLENFDESKFEIVDISTSYRNPDKLYGSDEFYIVTYKIIEEE